jgi:hypothetical protein
MNELLSVIRDKNTVKRLHDRCGEEVIGDGLECPFCGCKETYKDKKHPKDTDRWFFMIRAFRVDAFSECTNCGKWF